MALKEQDEHDINYHKPPSKSSKPVANYVQSPPNKSPAPSSKNPNPIQQNLRKPEGCPADLPLYELAPADCEELSKKLSCHQDIAIDGCFSLGMISHFEPTLQAKGAWMYPRLFWETGVLGQVLYLEAHAVGISATGIGCFFDDPVHEVLGLKGSDYQILYHFTVGGPIVDRRIMSLPAYPRPDIDA